MKTYRIFWGAVYDWGRKQNDPYTQDVEFESDDAVIAYVEEERKNWKSVSGIHELITNTLYRDVWLEYKQRKGGQAR